MRRFNQWRRARWCGRSSGAWRPITPRTVRCRRRWTGHAGWAAPIAGLSNRGEPASSPTTSSSTLPTPSTTITSAMASPSKLATLAAPPPSSLSTREPRTAVSLRVRRRGTGASRGRLEALSDPTLATVGLGLVRFSLRLWLWPSRSRRPSPRNWKGLLPLLLLFSRLILAGLFSEKVSDSKISSSLRKSG